MKTEFGEYTFVEIENFLRGSSNLSLFGVSFKHVPGGKKVYLVATFGVDTAKNGLSNIWANLLPGPAPGLNEQLCSQSPPDRWPIPPKAPDTP